MGAVFTTVWVSVLIVTGGVLTKRQEHALVICAAFPPVAVAVQCSAKVGKTSFRALSLSLPVVMVVVRAMELFLRSEADSRERLLGHLHSHSG